MPNYNAVAEVNSELNHITLNLGGSKTATFAVLIEDGELTLDPVKSSGFFLHQLGSYMTSELWQQAYAATRDNIERGRLEAKEPA